MIALIDGDILLYRIGYTTQEDSEGIAKVRVDDLIDSILLETGAKEFEVWLSDKTENGFRFGLYPQYKANRTQPRPTHYELLKEHLVVEWGARIALGMEADDALGITQTNGYKGWFETVICSIDKDLLQIPGQHYNFVKKEWQTLTPWEGKQWHYQQILIGDTVDNIRGCKGIGPVKAGKAILPIRSERGEGALFDACYQAYQKQEGKEKSKQEILDHILLVGRLLKIRQSEDEILWRFPEQSLITDLPKLSSTASVLVESTPSTEPTTQEKMSGFPPAGQLKDSTSLPEKPASILVEQS